MNRAIPFLLAICLMLFSCVKDIVLDAGEEPKVVVECVLTEDPVQELYLSYTKGVSQAEADLLPEAEARLVDLDEYNFSVPFSPAGKGKWVLDYAALPGHRYRLEVKVPGHDLITAETKMPEKCSVRHAFFQPHQFYFSSPGYGGEFEKVKKYGYSGGSYYYNFPDNCWVYYLNDDDTISEIICTNFPGVDSFNLTGEVYVSDSLTKPCISVEGDVPSLIKEQTAFLYPVLTGEDLHDKFLRIPNGERVSWINDPYPYPQVPNGKVFQDCLTKFSQSYQISGSFATQGKTGMLCFEALSKEYDQYLTAAMRALQIEKSTDISKIFLRENILESNVQGGLGIFGAKTCQALEWENFYSHTDYIMW